jgi:hypothetical protein
MRIFPIEWGPQTDKNIHVTRYVKTSNGVEIKIEHNAVARAGTELQWLQTVTSNNGLGKTCKLMTRVDPFGVGGKVNTVSLPAMPGVCKADDLLPFYWTAADLAAGAGPGFSDGPHVPAPTSGRTWNQFITALAEVENKVVRHMVAIAWGYDRMADGSVRVAVIRYATLPELANYFLSLNLMYPDYTYTVAES